MKQRASSEPGKLISIAVIAGLRATADITPIPTVSESLAVSAAARFTLAE